MQPGDLIAVYVGAAFAVSAALHTWYVAAFADDLSYGLPFSKRLRRGRPVEYGYGTAVGLGLLVALVVASYFQVVPPATLSIRAVLQVRFAELVVGGGALVLLSQALGGASWSRAVLDGASLFMAAILLVSYVQPPSFWNLFTVYATVVPTLGAAWGVWRDYYVARQIADADADGDGNAPANPRQVLYPHFPSFAYFAGSAAFALLVSLGLLLQNVR